MIQTLAAVGFFVLGVAALATLGTFFVIRWGKPLFEAVVEREWSTRWSEADQRIKSVEEDVGKLPRIWEEFAVDAKKAQERSRYHIRRVKKELEDRGLADDEIDRLDGTFHAVDGTAGNGSGVHELSGHVEEVPPMETTDPEMIALNRKWGHG